MTNITRQPLTTAAVVLGLAGAVASPGYAQGATPTRNILVNPDRTIDDNVDGGAEIGVRLSLEKLGRSLSGGPRAEQTDLQSGDSAPEPGRRVGDVFRDCTSCPELVVVPAGTFTMGSPSSEAERSDYEGPQHRVTIGAPFAVGRYEVMFAEWEACVADGGCRGYRPDDRSYSDMPRGPEEAPEADGYRPDDMERDSGERPVMNVSWEDAQSYVSWLSSRTGRQYRLLSESEWEYMARAGTTTRYWWGDSVGQNRANCYSSDCGDDYGRYRPAPVGAFPANDFGVFDVSGNVWEWVEDCWHNNYRGAPRDGSAWTEPKDDHPRCSTGRVMRGGSWSSDPFQLRSAGRAWNFVADRSRQADIGFRVARTID